MSTNILFLLISLIVFLFYVKQLDVIRHQAYALEENASFDEKVAISNKMHLLYRFHLVQLIYCLLLVFLSIGVLIGKIHFLIPAILLVLTLSIHVLLDDELQKLLEVKTLVVQFPMYTLLFTSFLSLIL